MPDRGGLEKVVEPKGPTEFGWGRGLMAPRSNKPPELQEQLRAVTWTESWDPDDTAERVMDDEWTREPPNGNVRYREGEM